MDQKAAAFAHSWATRYVRTKHPYGLDVEDVENRILESLYKNSRGKFPDGTDPNSDPAAMRCAAPARRTCAACARRVAARSRGLRMPPAARRRHGKLRRDVDGLSHG